MKANFWIGSALLASILGFAVYGVGSSLASGGYGFDDDDDEYGYRRAPNLQAMRVESKLYQEECGSCHLAYPPQLLPPASWSRIMNGLEDHFGENAELDGQTRQQIESYLKLLSTPRRGEYRKLLRNMDPNKAPLRITEMTYFKREHREIPRRFVTGNDQVRSFSQCDACHQDAARGSFDEDRVSIPGVGRWDD